MKYKRTILLSLLTTFLMGCSSKVLTKAEIIQPKPFTFTIIDVNLTYIPPTKPLLLDGKINFIDDSNKTICMNVGTWIAIKHNSQSKTKEKTLLRLHNTILTKAYNSLLKQIQLYYKTMQTTVDCPDCKTTILKDINDTRTN